MDRVNLSWRALKWPTKCVSGNPVKRLLILHGSCLVLAWIIGPYFSAWLTEMLVSMGMRGDFTWLDLLMRVFALILFEVGLYAFIYFTGRAPAIP